MNDQLLYAILAMDSYNRGTNAGLRGLGRLNSEIGTATLRAEKDDAAARLVDFYAAQYDASTSAGSKQIISYRGTDNLGWDALTGWTSGLGISMAPQAVLAEQFYTAITGKNPFELAANTVLTGHSLGGGLAGYLASMSGTEASIFDHSPYGGAAVARVILENLGRTGYDVIQLRVGVAGYTTLQLPVGLPLSGSITATSVLGQALMVPRIVAPALTAGALILRARGLDRGGCDTSGR